MVDSLAIFFTALKFLSRQDSCRGPVYTHVSNNRSVLRPSLFALKLSSLETPSNEFIHILCSSVVSPLLHYVLPILNLCCLIVAFDVCFVLLMVASFFAVNYPEYARWVFVADTLAFACTCTNNLYLLID